MANSELIYTLWLQLRPQQEGRLLLVSDIISEDVYNTILPNLTTDSHKGKLEASNTSTGLTLRLSFTSLEGLNNGLKDILELGQTVVISGFDNEEPRPELLHAFENLTTYWDNTVPQVHNLTFLNVIPYSEQNAPKSIEPVLDVAHLVPRGYSAKLRGVEDV